MSDSVVPTPNTEARLRCGHDHREHRGEDVNEPAHRWCGEFHHAPHTHFNNGREHWCSGLSTKTQTPASEMD